MCSPKTLQKDKVIGPGSVACNLLSEALDACPLKRTPRMVVSLSLSLSNSGATLILRRGRTLPPAQREQSRGRGEVAVARTPVPAGPGLKLRVMSLVEGPASRTLAGTQGVMLCECNML